MAVWDVRDHTGQYDDAILPRVVISEGDVIRLWALEEAERCSVDVRELSGIKRRIYEAGLDFDYDEYEPAETDDEGRVWGWERWLVFRPLR